MTPYIEYNIKSIIQIRPAQTHKGRPIQNIREQDMRYVFD